MAQYQVPPDPRRESPRRRRERAEREPVPWRWLALGVLVTIGGLALAVNIAGRVLAREPLPTAAIRPGPTVIRLTAPPSPIPSRTPVRPTPSAIPTITPQPTADVATPPPEVRVGFYAVVANTDGLGVTVRVGPDIVNTAVTLADEGAVLLVISGPEEGGNLTWWQVRLTDETEGWVAADFLEPAAPPPDAPAPEGDG